MVRAVVLTTAFLLGASLPLQTQNQPGNLLNLHTGVAFPMSPQPFSDFWSLGIMFGGGLTVPIAPATSLEFLFDYENFGLDDEAFFKALEIQPTDHSVSGSRTTIICLSSNIRYHLGDTSISPFFVGAGSGFLLTTIGAGTANYKGYIITQGRKSHLRLFLRGTFGIDFIVTKEIGAYVCAQYTFAVGKNELTNTDALSMVAGATFPM